MRSSLVARAALRVLLRKAGGATRRLGGALGRAEATLATPAVLRLEQERGIGAAMRAHDMAHDPDEAYYRDRYWAWIEAQLEHHRADLSGVFLDAGCGPGRLTLPLARLVAPEGGSVVGVDMLGDSLEAARELTAQAGLSNVGLRQADLLEFLAEQEAESFAGALFLEVPYIVFDLAQHLRQLRRVLRPGGVLLTSFRTQQYLALTAILRRDWVLARSVLNERSGYLRGMGWQNWHTADDAAALLRECGFIDAAFAGVGIGSGIAGDPLALIARPSTLSGAELDELAAVETALAASHPDVGRYLLASAMRP